MRSARIKSAMDPAPEDMVPDDDFYKYVPKEVNCSSTCCRQSCFFSLQRRVDRIEASIAPLASNLDSVLVRVGATKKYNKRDMEHVFDQILQSDDSETFLPHPVHLLHSCYMQSAIYLASVEPGTAVPIP